MDIVLGVSLAPDSVRLVLVQGESADGTTIDENEFLVDDAPTVSASDRVIAAVVGTRDDANRAGIAVSSVGVACTDQLAAAALRDALAAHKVENVMLVSAFVAAAALAQSAGAARGYENTAMLLVEPDIATLAVVETSDGSASEVHTTPVLTPDALADMVAGLGEGPGRPGGLMVIGHGVDVGPLARSLQESTTLAVSAPEQPETALARGAALASAHAFATSTTALAYAQDPDTGGFPYLGGGRPDGHAYSAVDDDGVQAPTVVLPNRAAAVRRSKLLVGSAIAVAGFSAALALEVALTVGVHTTVGMLPAPLHNLVAPAEQVLAPEPVVTAKAVTPAPSAPIALTPPPVAPPPDVPGAAVPPVPVPAAPVPLALPSVPPVPLPPIHLPDPPASPPAVQAPPPARPPTQSPPPQSPPAHQKPPGQGTAHNPGVHPGSGAPANGQTPSSPSGSGGNTQTGGGPRSGGTGSAPGGSSGGSVSAGVHH
ncbi:hypothetical protein A5714_02310 [Mycobacterium sp. E2462]|uniref:DUF7159 family protein n=1 Tax=Mycobacterium sp. E2462 TaxID=1834133 RepID=UPI0007FE2B55|nr:hypothetical protein [Mycobacterium sp. E2462]OBI06575.1 hypothetical protein A5714_02310 [Mycobacterium sp. E2462]